MRALRVICKRTRRWKDRVGIDDPDIPVLPEFLVSRIGTSPSIQMRSILGEAAYTLSQMISWRRPKLGKQQWLML